MAQAVQTVPRTRANLKKCQCMKCPTYTFMCKMKNMPGLMIDMVKDLNKVDDLEGMYCAFTSSKCIEDEKGCICTTCEVFKEYNLDKLYYCLGGKAAA